MSDVDPHKSTYSKNKSYQKLNAKVYLESQKIRQNRISNPKNAIVHSRNQKWGWVGHVARLSPDRWTYYAAFWTFAFKKRKKRGKRKKWKDDFDQFLQNKFFHRVAHERKAWERIWYTVALRGPGVLSV